MRVIEKITASVVRSELYFTEMQQCEAFLAVLVAPFQELPDWVYLTAYRPGDMEEKAKQVLAGDVAALSGNRYDRGRNFLKYAVYAGFEPNDRELKDRWNENIDNIAAFIEFVARRYIEGIPAYNAYKHGLRVTAGSAWLSVRVQGSSEGSTFAVRNVITYLWQQRVEQDWVVRQATKEYSPDASFHTVMFMGQLLEVMRSTRLTRLEQRPSLESLDTFLHLHRAELDVMDEQARHSWDFPL
jgi:hypothetical protein